MIRVSDLERCARFYDARLAALGLPRLVRRQRTIGFGKTYPEFWINLREAMPHVAPESGVHICLRAKMTGEVERFPLRPAAHPTARRASARTTACVTYAAFVVDPDGNWIETTTFPAE